MPDIAVFLQSVKLPVMSEVAHALIRTLNDDNASNQEVGAIIARDAALTARLLRLANSASFGLSRRVATLDDAIALVGMGRVRTLGLAASMGDAFPVVDGLSRTEFWHSCMVSAGYGQWLSSQIGLDTSHAWLASMMVRLGELMIAQAQPASLAEIEKLPHPPGGRWERETRLTGFSEGQITAELARRWNFPAEIVHALDAASDPMASKPFDRLAAVVHLAMLLADMPPGGPEMLDALPAEVVQALQLRTEWMRARFPAPESFIDLD
ncbi:HDOD domain-containing protein [Pseudorhodoferax soli]|uniref:HD-like signal output (HDOD) protein n=1 Tax=Pseudorhodoferax soli TaxID=545864 RepID=A0A368YBY4_9BURK|nr:HDOD domain-containing protein [Pseudorhodoferax soli]RCW75704.1 HD-like signal output (HDOD) protein [Pseudorhodoferax soli]